MSTQLRKWSIRLIAAGALPTMLTLGLGAAANAQSTLASHVTNSTEHASHHDDYEVFGPYDSYRDCLRAQYEHGGHHSYSICKPEYRGSYHHHHGYYAWYLYVYYR